MKLTTEQKVQRAHVALMGNPDYCLYSGIFMLGETKVVDDIPTACTNGRDVSYGRKFIDGLEEEEIRGVVLHENLHKAFRQLTTWKELWKEDAKLANMACDYVINLMIYDSDVEGKFVKLPEGGCLDTKYRGMDAGTVYRLLKQDKEDGKGQGSGQGSGEGQDIHDWEGAGEISEEQREGWEEQVDHALRQGKAHADRLGGAVPREIGELLAPKISWKDVLRDYITAFCADKDVSTWRKPNRRWIDQDVYLPSLIGESMGRLVIAIDTSGSISSAIIGEVLNEVKHICETVSPDGIDLLYWDTVVAQHEKYDRDSYDSMMSTTKPKGGGGTTPQCIPDYIQAHKIEAECVLVLTDGYVGDWGKGWTTPVLWGITSKGVIADVGTSIYVGN